MRTTRRAGAPRGARIILVSAASAGGVYVLGTAALAALCGCGFNETALFQPAAQGGMGFLTGTLSAAVFLAGFPLLFFIPGAAILLNFPRSGEDPRVFSGLSVLASLAALIAATTLQKAVLGTELSRSSLFAAAALITASALGALFLRRTPAPPRRKADLREAKPYAIFAAAAFGILLVLGPRLLDRRPPHLDYSERTILSISQGTQSDSLEVFGLADSLKRHLLPYWDLEYADRFGYPVILPPLHLFAASFSVLFFGESQPALALSSITFTALAFLLILGQGRGDKRLRLFLCVQFFLGYIVFFAGRPPQWILPDHLFLSLLSAFIVFLLRGNYRTCLLFATAATLTRYQAFYFIAAAFAGGFLLFRKRRAELASISLRYAGVLIGMTAFIAGLGLWTGDIGVYAKSLLVEQFARFDHAGLLHPLLPESIPYPPAGRPFKFILNSLRATSFSLPALLLLGRDREENLLSWVGLLYFAAILFGTYHQRRYALPLIPFASLAAMSKLEKWTSRRRGCHVNVKS